MVGVDRSRSGVRALRRALAEAARRDRGARAPLVVARRPDQEPSAAIGSAETDERGVEMTSDLGRPVVAGVDGSDSARQAAFWAADEARRRNVPLRLVGVVHLPAFDYPGSGVPVDDFAGRAGADAERRLATVRSDILDRYPGLDVDTATRVGQPNAVLVEESADALLLVVGSRGLGGFTDALVGSTGVALSVHGHCPVAVVRPGDPDGPVVVGVDGSPASEAAIALAFDEASSRGAELVAVHAWLDYASEVSYATARQYAVDWEAVDVHEHELLAQRLAGWQEKYPDVSVRRVVTTDRPVRSLLEQAAQARLLVVGSRGRGGFRGMLFGSTSQALVYHAPCPLLVARPTV